jgi:hypothetical protein
MAGKLPSTRRTSELKNSFGTVLSYGPAGAGKTRSIKTLVDHGLTPMILRTELGETGGLLSIQGTDIDYLVIEDQIMMIDVIKAMKRKPGVCEYEQKAYDTVILDSITQWGEFPLDRYMELMHWEDLHGVNAKGSGKDPRAAYGYLAEKGRQLYKEMFELHAHLYVIAREGLFGGGDEALFAAPELPGQKLPREVPGWPDATVRLRVISGQHRMITKGEGGSPARVRLPENFDSLPGRALPDIGALIKYMCGDASMKPFLVPDPKREAEMKAAAAAEASEAAKAAVA